MVEAEQFAEDAVDELRKSKFDELLKLRKQMEQEARMQQVPHCLPICLKNVEAVACCGIYASLLLCIKAARRHF